MAKGRRTKDCIYRLLCRRSIQTGHQEAASVLWDIQKAFENVHRDRLLHMARRFSFPLKWLRLSLASYSWERILTVEHAAGKSVVSQLGIGAGAMSATYELHVYMLAMMHAHQAAYPQVFHVDDTIRDFRVDEATILEQVLGSNQLLVDQLGDLGLPLAKGRAGGGQELSSGDPHLQSFPWRRAYGRILSPSLGVCLHLATVT
jgi:hypothetical protein